MKSWKTTLAGAVTALGTYFASVGDPEWMKHVGQLMAISGPFIGGLFSRDNDKTSEDLGLK